LCQLKKMLTQQVQPIGTYLTQQQEME